MIHTAVVLLDSKKLGWEQKENVFKAVLNYALPKLVSFGSGSFSTGVQVDDSGILDSPFLSRVS